MSLKTAKYWYNLALTQNSLKEYDTAIESCEKAIEIESNFAKAWKLIGEIRYNQGDRSKAVKAFEKAITLDETIRNDPMYKEIREMGSPDSLGGSWVQRRDEDQKRKRNERRKFLVDEQRRKEEEVEVAPINTDPKTAEEAMLLLNQSQGDIERVLNLANYSQAIPLLEARDVIFQKAIKLFQGIGMLTLIPTLESEKKKSFDLLYEVRHNLWTSKYNELSDEISKLQANKEFVQSTEKINQVLVLIDQRKQMAQDHQNSEDVAKLTQLYLEFHNLLKTNNAVATYNRLEEFYNEIVRKIENQQLTDALKNIPDLLKELEQLKSSIQPEIGQNQALAGVMEPIENLLAQTGRLNSRIETQFAAILKGATSTIPTVARVSAEIRMPEISKMALGIIKTPLYAKVVLLGESSVGKTHLVLTATGQEYSTLQGSTVGVDKYFKPVKISMAEYDTQLCFWDLGGQWNFRSINELFLNEAAAVILVYDVTRPDTFQALQYWIDLVKQIRGPSKNQIFIVGNKLDVGGNAVPDKDQTAFLARNGLAKIYCTSAKNNEGIKPLMEDLAGAIDWSTVLGNVDSTVINSVGGLLKSLRVSNKIMKTTDLMNTISSNPKVQGSVDSLVVKSVLRQYATQEIIQFGRSELFVILDPELIGKWVAKMISLAAQSDGLISREDFLKSAGTSKIPFDLLFQYLESENICYAYHPGTWIFPNVLHKGEPKIEESTNLILDSDPKSIGFQLKGPGDLIFTRLIVALARELGSPEFASNVAGVWTKGQGSNKTALLIHFFPSPDGCVIRVKVGGGRGSEELKHVQDIARHVYAAYASEVSTI